MKVLVTPLSLCKNQDSKPIQRLRQYADEIIYNPVGRPLRENEIGDLLAGVDGILAGLDFYTEEAIRTFPDTVRAISRYGIGYDRVDLKAAGEKGIAVSVTPGANSLSVADLAIGLLLSVARRIPQLDSRVRKGEWPHVGGVEMSGKTIGVVGLGAIGKAVAQRAAGFSMRVLAYDPYISLEYAKSHGIESVPLENLLNESDFVTLHLPVNDGTRNMINGKTIREMKDGAILINTSRGGLMDEGAVCEALKSGKLYGLGIDAFAVEPPVNNPLLELDRVVATPHIGANTKEASEKMGLMAVDNLIHILKKEACANIVNQEYLDNR